MPHTLPDYYLSFSETILTIRSRTYRKQVAGYVTQIVLIYLFIYLFNSFAQYSILLFTCVFTEGIYYAILNAFIASIDGIRIIDLF